MSNLGQNKFWKSIDMPIILLYITLVLIGWLNIYAAVFDESHASIFDLEKNYGKQLLWIATALFIGLMVLLIDSKFFSVFSFGIYGITLLMLIAVLFFGKYVNGSRSWFEIGSFRLQPAEFAKFATALVVAKYLSSGVKMERFSTKISVLGLIGLPMGLILLQGDVGSALTYVAFILVLYREGLSGMVLVIGLLIGIAFVLSLLFAKAAILISIAVITAILLYNFRRKKKIIPVIIAGAALVATMVVGFSYVFNNVMKQHHRDRINNLVGKEIDIKGAGYNVNQSKIAIGSGRLIGKGFLNGTQTKYDFVPEQSTDFIFCTIGEEYGFVGSVILIGLFLSEF